MKGEGAMNGDVVKGVAMKETSFWSTSGSMHPSGMLSRLKKYFLPNI